MTDLENAGARIEALEMRIAYQDQTIDDLNKAITAQWKLIESLTQQIARVDDRVQRVEEGAGASSEPEPPPPHY